jgi:hypothetical protein
MSRTTKFMCKVDIRSARSHSPLPASFDVVCYSCAAQSAAITPEVFEAFWRKLFSAPPEEELEIGNLDPSLYSVGRRQVELCSAVKRRHMQGANRCSL